ncbi:MAG: DNA starvation/stationary phase protection protein [Winkia neuii]|uniref:DNA starvation/stationary phase protection protein n=1 Tax=Winkia neuii TaxID=33007 RepID=A0A2I1IR33_9ACTO|nr:DNA starvation/stationary phase protection protein [Winkia neuii]OFJ71985.1 DNA starvation/stationary phase protection protein [Actinomyces sp. HMSC064C12]OFK01715.1 DNA starvation/stationary phase protection protein [Actinomyces sp. HMSC072A03]OFT54763.1 DNA starvation/stationary phase protection protein [Actinomyces sp. HMSC06A08]MDK8100517.1 DNA starvation/stationary phase protection protein [Winkia neuii]MDU3133968.1 DNA starvation/stationary phase protection protein [Winkia neuii]
MVKVEGIVGDTLQQTLVDLIALELQAKQAHWNIKGPNFRALHLALDEVVSLVRNDLDEVAERLATIGGNPDGREATVAKTSSLDELESGDLPVDKTYEVMAQKVQAVCDKIRENLSEADDADPITGDLLITVVSGLEQQAWFLRSATK